MRREHAQVAQPSRLLFACLCEAIRQAGGTRYEAH